MLLKSAGSRACLTGALAMLAMLGACGPQKPAPQPAPPPPPAPLPPPPAPVVQAAPERPWDVADLTAGDWSYRQDGRDPVATFGQPETLAIVELRCDLARHELSFSIAGRAGFGATMAIRTSSGQLNWPVAGDNDGIEDSSIVVRRPASDKGFDWIAYSRGRIAIEVAGQPRLIIPVWAEISRVIEDCRG